MSPNQYYASPHVETSHGPGNAIGPRTAGAEQSCLQAQRNDRYDSFRLDMIGWLNIYIFLFIGWELYYGWFLLGCFIGVRPCHMTIMTNMIMNITNQTFMAHNQSPWEMTIPTGSNWMTPGLDAHGCPIRLRSNGLIWETGCTLLETSLVIPPLFMKTAPKKSLWWNYAVP